MNIPLRKKLIRFLSYQLAEIRDGTKASVWEKAYKGFLWGGGAIAGVIFLPFVLIIWVLKPIRSVRFGYFLSHRIGHFAFDVEYYLSGRERDKRDDKRSTIDVFFLVGAPCNSFLVDLVKRELRVSPLVRIPYFSHKLMPWKSGNLVLPAWKINGSRDHMGYLANTGPHLSLSDSEDRAGVEFLGRFNWKPGEQIVCLIVRDSAYLNTIQSGKDWNYHSYRDTQIANYHSAALALARSGYWVFRMGKEVESKFGVTHPRIVDYANSAWRSDFLDVWLTSHCEFCISTSTGFDSVAAVFRKPLALVNFMPLAEFQTWSSCVLAPSHLIWKKSNRKLTCREHLVHCYMRTEQYEAAGIEVQELSPQEINYVVEEVESRITGSWVDTVEAMEKQSRFWEIYKANQGWTPKKAFFHSEARISTRFLDNHPNFLD